jgi:hypothetical protein
VYRLAADIADGPVLHLPAQRIVRFEDQADKALRMLDAFENRDHTDGSPVVEPYGM